MEYDKLQRFFNNHIEPYLQYIEMWQCIKALGIKPTKCYDGWSFRFSERGEQGICGYGKTIDEAAWDFYKNLKQQID